LLKQQARRVVPYLLYLTVLPQNGQKYFQGFIESFKKSQNGKCRETGGKEV